MKGRWRNRLIWLCCLAVPMLELQVIIRWLQQLGLDAYTTEATFKLTLFAILLGAWAWLFAGERLPDYYDENRVTVYINDVLRLHIPGLTINNRNWPHVLKAIRVWTVVTSILPMTLSVLFRDILWWFFADKYTLVPLLLAALILPVIFLARWYELEEQPSGDTEENEREQAPAPTSDHQVDKARIGEFIAGERKRLGLTQKELAARLYVSDKAVSKWERGLSIPDVGMLIPLAELLGVTVTELLEGRRIQPDPGTGIEMREVEQVVKKALSLTGESREGDRLVKRRRRLIWIGCTIAALLELWVMLWYMRPIPESTWVLVLLAVIFGGWAWLGAKERLPAYYDQNRISYYSDGIFKIHMGGLAFNNRNWPYILKAIRVWSIAAALLPQPLSIVGGMILRQYWARLERLIFLPLFLGGLFVPVYVVGRRYEEGDPRQ